MAEGEGANAALIQQPIVAQQPLAPPPQYAYPVQPQQQNYGSAITPQQFGHQQVQPIVAQPIVVQPQVVQPQVVQPQVVTVVPQQMNYTRITSRQSQQALCPRCQQVCDIDIKYINIYIYIYILAQTYGIYIGCPN